MKCDSGLLIVVSDSEKMLERLGHDLLGDEATLVSLNNSAVTGKEAMHKSIVCYRVYACVCVIKVM